MGTLKNHFVFFSDDPESAEDKVSRLIDEHSHRGDITVFTMQSIGGGLLTTVTIVPHRISETSTKAPPVYDPLYSIPGYDSVKCDYSLAMNAIAKKSAAVIDNRCGYKFYVVNASDTVITVQSEKSLIRFCYPPGLHISRHISEADANEFIDTIKATPTFKNFNLIVMSVTTYL